MEFPRKRHHPEGEGAVSCARVSEVTTTALPASVPLAKAKFGTGGRHDRRISRTGRAKEVQGTSNSA